MVRMLRCLIPFLALTACAQFPALEASISPSAQDADYPDLVQWEPLLAAAVGTPQRNANIEQALDRRAAALRSRAAQLRGPVVDRATRARMRRGVAPI